MNHEFFCEIEQYNILNTYVSEIIQQWCFIETNASEKQSSKVWKIVTPRSIFAFFSSITTYKKIDEKRKTFTNDLMKTIVKGLLPLSIVENISMRLFGLWKDPRLVFPSCKTLTKKIFPLYGECTLEKFVLLYINVIDLSQQQLTFGWTKVHLIILPLWLIY